MDGRLATARSSAGDADLVVVGAGAAGLTAAIWAARAGRLAHTHHADSLRTRPRVVVLDGARTLGAKILVAGGGRCNVTHAEVSERDFNGSTPAAIRRILRRFPVRATIEFFASLGVQLRREETGKLFPATNRARDVLEALLRECRMQGVELVHPWRVGVVETAGDAFIVHRADGRASMVAPRLVLATGGQSLPKSGSDGTGYSLASHFAHHVVSPMPALVPLLLDRSRSPLPALSGVSARVRLELRSGSGKRQWSEVGELLCAHFGVSGPVVLDASRHYLAWRRVDPAATLTANWLPEMSLEEVDQALSGLGRRSVLAWLRERVPDRVARALGDAARLPSARVGAELTREERLRLRAVACEMPLPVVGTRGFTHAEVTAGGVPLSELHLESLESRLRPGLYFAGEILDVDGRIGGFNFQWAWASGYVAGMASGTRMVSAPQTGRGAAPGAAAPRFEPTEAQ